MKNYLTILAILILALFTSCTSNDKIDTNHLDEDRTLRLNSGEKWNSSTSMVHGMNKLNAIVNNVDMKYFDPKMIGHKLDFEIRMMMSTCGATGEAHDQFHYYLDPLKEQINGLRIANEVAKNPLLTSIKMHLDSYKNYFN